MGRPSKLTDETKRKIIDAISVGSTYEIAAGYAGVSYVTFNSWMQRGEAAKGGEFLEFFNAVKEAEGKAAVKWLAVIEKASVEQWQAAAWKLERRYPHQYGRQVHEVSVSVSPEPTADERAQANKKKDEWRAKRKVIAE